MNNKPLDIIIFMLNERAQRSSYIMSVLNMVTAFVLIEQDEIWIYQKK